MFFMGLYILWLYRSMRRAVRFAASLLALRKSTEYIIIVLSNDGALYIRVSREHQWTAKMHAKHARRRFIWTHDWRWLSAVDRAQDVVSLATRSRRRCRIFCRGVNELLAERPPGICSICVLNECQGVDLRLIEFELRFYTFHLANEETCVCRFVILMVMIGYW